MQKIISSGKLERKLETFSEQQRKHIFGNVRAIELTEGCSTGCTDCGLGALKGVRDYIPYSVITDIFSQYSEQLGKKRAPILYFASEPFDYNFDGKDYVEVHSSFQSSVEKNPCVITSIPKGKEKLIFSYIFGENEINGESFIDAVSLTKFNYKRVEKKMLELSYFAFQKKGFFQKDYLVKLPNGVEISSNKRINLNNLSGEINLLKNGCKIRDFVNDQSRINFKRNDKSNLPWGGINYDEGYLINPSGIYSLEVVQPSKKFPTGQKITEVSSKDDLFYSNH